MMLLVVAVFMPVRPMVVGAAPVGLGGSGGAYGQTNGSAKGGARFDGLARKRRFDPSRNPPSLLPPTGAMYAVVSNCYLRRGGRGCETIPAS